MATEAAVVDTMLSTNPVDEPTEAPTNKSADVVVDVSELIAQGKRNLLCGEALQAVNQFQEACSKLGAKYGETADECAEAYLLYGKSLLELSRMESGVLGNALQGITEDEGGSSQDEAFEEKDSVTEEEKEKISEQVIDAMVESREPDKDETSAVNGAEATSSTDTAKESAEPGTSSDTAVEKTCTETGETSTSSVTGETSVPADTETGETSAPAEMGEASDSQSDEEGADMEDDTVAGDEETTDEKAEDEDVTNLQLSWEMLELAKNIYARRADMESKLKLAECHLKLGEVSLETEQYAQSIEDFQSCLDLQKSALDPSDRRLAETHYQLGLAYASAMQYTEAITHYRAAAESIETKIAAVQQTIDTAAEQTESKGKEPATEAHPVMVAQKELAELRDILPDIQAKIDDAEEEQKTSVKLKEMIRENVVAEMSVTTTGFGDATTSSDAVNDARPVDNVMHLVRKKKKVPTATLR